MKRLSDNKFVEMQPNEDSVFALRIKNGDFFFIAWMENAENYFMTHTKHPVELYRDVVMNGDIFGEIMDMIEKEVQYSVDRSTDIHNEYEYFLEYVEPYTRNGKSDQDDHEIFALTIDEFQAICDSLRDGDYVFVIE